MRRNWGKLRRCLWGNGESKIEPSIVIVRKKKTVLKLVPRIFGCYLYKICRISLFDMNLQKRLFCILQLRFSLFFTFLQPAAFVLSFS